MPHTWYSLERVDLVSAMKEVDSLHLGDAAGIGKLLRLEFVVVLPGLEDTLQEGAVGHANLGSNFELCFVKTFRFAHVCHSLSPVLVFCQFARGYDNLFLVGEKPFFKRRRERDRRVEPRDAGDRPVEILECILAHNRRNFTRDTARTGVLVYNEQLVRLLHRGEKSLAIEWKKGTQVDHFGVDSFARELLGRLERGV